MKAAIVVPTIRKENFDKFLDVWNEEFKGQTIIAIEDNPEPTFDISGSNVKHFSWLDIDRDLCEYSWIIPRKTDCIRSYGYLKAYHEQVDMVVTMDDDCYPSSSGFLNEHYEKLTSPAVSVCWTPTGAGVTTRGTPYHDLFRERECVINHGLWTKVADFDAITQLSNGRLRSSFDPVDQVIPFGSYFPMCGMNLAFKPHITPAMYFLLMGQRNWPFDRFGDIWCGIIIKKLCDHLGAGIKSGSPLVEHQRASNVWENLRKELPGYEINEIFWKKVDSIVLTHSTFKDCYSELAENLLMTGEYWDSLRQAMRIWSDLF